MHALWITAEKGVRVPFSLANPGDYEGYVYDNNGNVTTKRLRSGDTVTFAYDALNRVTSAVFPAGKSQNVYWGYDLLNRGLYARYGSASGPGVSYAYDALGRMTSETSVNKTLAYRYDAAGNRTQVTWPETGANALHVVYVYDVLNRVTQVQENGATSGPGLLATYAYDSLGRRSTVARAGGAGASTAYAYDAASRLYTLTQTLAGSASVTYTLGYNAAGQVLTKQVSNSAYVAHPASLTAGYVANGLNQYVSVTGVTASYTPANSATLSYDPAGRLQSETTAGATTSLLYSGDALVGEYSSAGNIVARYVMGPGVDEPLVWYQGAGTSTRRWLTADNQGSVIGYADGGGNSGATYTYGPYGEPIVSGGASAWGGSRYRFTGQIEIPEGQLYYYKARVYDPNLGRFYQTDPAGLGSGLNSYAYVGNDPVNAIDPTGEVSFICTPSYTPFASDGPDGEFDATLFLNTSSCIDFPDFGGSGGGLPSGITIPQLPPISPPTSPPTSPKPVPRPKSTPKNNQNQSCPSSGGLRAPDFGRVSGSLPIPNKFTGSFVGVGVALTADRYGGDYLSLNVVAGIPTAGGINVMGGWMNTASIPSEAQLGGMISDWGAGLAGGYILGLGFSGNGSGNATSAGLTTPGVSADVGYTWKLPIHTPSWCR